MTNSEIEKGPLWTAWRRKLKLTTYRNYRKVFVRQLIWDNLGVLQQEVPHDQLRKLKLTKNWVVCQDLRPLLCQKKIFFFGPPYCRMVSGCLASPPVQLFLLESLTPKLEITLNHQALAFYEYCLFRLPADNFLLQHLASRPVLPDWRKDPPGDPSAHHRKTKPPE